VNIDIGGVDSEANVTEIHAGLHLDEMEGGQLDAPQGHFGIFSICWAGSGQEIAAGTGDSSVLVYNMERGKVHPVPQPILCFSVLPPPPFPHPHTPHL